MQYYVVKSGMEQYDLSRIFGLGLILSKLSGTLVEVRDLGSYYVINVQKKPKLENVEDLAGLAEAGNNWDYLFLTARREKKKKKKECEEMIVNKEIIHSILKNYANLEPSFFYHVRKRRERETLYQTMDLSATKGFRERIRGRTYQEGTQIYISKEDFLLSVIGHLRFTIWKWISKQQLVMVLFSPSENGIEIGGGPFDARCIVEAVEKNFKAHRAGLFPTLAYSALHLIKEILERKRKEKKFPKVFFSNLIFGSMSGGLYGILKPSGGGIYPLDFLYKIMNSTKVAEDIIEYWIEIFNSTNKNGYENLALCLSAFIAYPSKETLEKYLKVHLHFFLNKKIKLYQTEILKEVLKCLKN